MELQENNNHEMVDQLQKQKKDVEAAQTAHMLLATTAMEHMKTWAERSHVTFKYLIQWRRKSIFAPTRFQRWVYKIAWYIGITRQTFVYLCDYQKVF